MAAPTKRCVFCGYVGTLTDEHVWGKWIKKYIPIERNKHTDSIVRIPKPGQPEPPTYRTRAGDPITSKVGVVCENCNTRWLSQIQERAETHLRPLLRGESHTLGRSARAIVASWATMVTMTGEYMMRGPAEAAVPQEHRNWLMRARTPPKGWRIWIGHCDHWGRNGQWVHVRVPLVDTEHPAYGITPDGGLAYLQTTATRLGKFYLFTMSSAFDEIPRMWDWRSTPRARFCLQQIWPDPEWDVTWPFVRMNAADAEAISTAYMASSDALALKEGYLGFPKGTF